MTIWLAIIFIVAALILRLIGGFLLLARNLVDRTIEEKPTNQRRNASYDDDANGSKTFSRRKLIK